MAFLQLTLSKWKWISSVIRHLNQGQSKHISSEYIFKQEFLIYSTEEHPVTWDNGAVLSKHKILALNSTETNNCAFCRISVSLFHACQNPCLVGRTGHDLPSGPVCLNRQLFGKDHGTTCTYWSLVISHARKSKIGLWDEQTDQKQIRQMNWLGAWGWRPESVHHQFIWSVWKWFSQLEFAPVYWTRNLWNRRYGV